MKPKNIVLVVFFAAILAAGWWLLMRSKAAVSGKTMAVTMSAKSATPMIVAQSRQVELPKAPAVPASSSTASADSSPDPSDPQADLKTAIPDIVHWLRVDDMLTVKTNYMPPNTLTPTQLEQWQESMVRSMAYADQSTDPTLREAMQRIHDGQLKEFESFENQTPKYNATGDEATYTYKRDPLIDGDDTQVTVTFVKINGRWYMK